MQTSTADVLGRALSGGEAPQLTAASLHVLRTGVIDALSEAGQRQLLDRFLALQVRLLALRVRLLVPLKRFLALQVPPHAFSSSHTPIPRPHMPFMRATP